jgi:phage shock protein A
MRVWARLADIISANVNALLDRVEDPERLLAQAIRDMEDGLLAARSQAATVIAATRRLGRELEQNRAAARHWHDQARRACRAGREDLAREALRHKVEHDEIVRTLEAQFAEAQKSSHDVKNALHTLEARLAEARRQQRTLLARFRVAKVRLDARRASTALPDTVAPLSKLARLEERLLDMEDELLAHAEITGSPAEELADLELSRKIESEFAVLRNETSQSAPA